MYYPTFDEIQRLRDIEIAAHRVGEHGRPLLPLYRDILADLETPVSAYCKTARGPYSFLLESVTGGERVGRYSFIGIDPYMVITHRGTQATLYRMPSLNGHTVSEQVSCYDPLELIKQELGQFSLITPAGIAQD